MYTSQVVSGQCETRSLSVLMSGCGHGIVKPQKSTTAYEEHLHRLLLYDAKHYFKQQCIRKATRQHGIMACCNMRNASEHTKDVLFITGAVGRHCALKLALICTSKQLICSVWQRSVCAADADINPCTSTSTVTCCLLKSKPIIYKAFCSRIVSHHFTSDCLLLI